MGRLLLVVLLLAAPAAALERERYVVVVIGDSIAAGLGAQSSKRELTHRLEDLSHGAWFMLNVSRNGTSFTGSVLPPLNPDLLGLPGVTGDRTLIMLGVNDFQTSQPTSDVAHALDELLARAVTWHIAITCVTPIWLTGEETSTNNLGLRLEDYRAVIRDRCTVAGGSIVEGIDLVPHDATLFFGGRLHPNDRGYSFLAKRLYLALLAQGW